MNGTDFPQNVPQLALLEMNLTNILTQETFLGHGVGSAV